MTRVDEVIPGYSVHLRDPRLNCLDVDLQSVYHCAALDPMEMVNSIKSEAEFRCLGLVVPGIKVFAEHNCSVPDLH